MDVLSKELLKRFINMDEKVVLYAPDGSFEIPLSVMAAKMYSPVIKATLESPLNKGDEVSIKDSKALYRLQRIEVKGFTHEIVQLFARCLQGQADETEIKTYDWKKIRGLYEMSHFYQVDDVFNICLEKGKASIQHTNILEAIALMETYGFDQVWCDHIVQLLISNPDPFNQPDWKNSITTFPNTLCQIQYWYIKRKLGYG